MGIVALSDKCRDAECESGLGGLGRARLEDGNANAIGIGGWKCDCWVVGLELRELGRLDGKSRTWPVRRLIES